MKRGLPLKQLGLIFIPQIAYYIRLFFLEGQGRRQKYLATNNHGNKVMMSKHKGFNHPLQKLKPGQGPNNLGVVIEPDGKNHYYTK